MGAAGMPVEQSEDFRELHPAAWPRSCKPEALRHGRRARPRHRQRHPVRARPADPRPRHQHHRRRPPAPDRGHRLRPAPPGAARRRSPSTSRRRCWRTCRRTCSPASCSARCGACAPTVEDKLNRLPLSYVDRQPRGDLLSRVTNDIDNVAQSLQQTLSQLLTSTLTVVGVLIMMFMISPLLSLVALVTIPVSLLTIKVIAKRSKARFVAQWTPHRRAQRAGRGGLHRPRAGEGVRPPARRRGALQREERGALRGQLRRPVHLRDHPAGDDVPRQPQLRGHRRDRRPAGHVGRDDDRRHPGLHPVLPPVHPAAHPAGVDGQRAAVRHRLGRAGLRAARRRRAGRRRGQPAPRRAAARAGSSSTTCRSPTTRTTRSSRTCRSSPSPARRSPSSDPPAPARPRWSTSSCGSTSSTAARIRLDGHDISKMRRRDLRSNIGMVLQDTWLFGGTIRENIAYGNLDATEEQILEAARATYVDRFVHSLPDGYDTDHRRRGRHRQRRREAAAHHRPRLPRRTPPSSSSTRPPARSTPAPRC